MPSQSKRQCEQCADSGAISVEGGAMTCPDAPQPWHKARTLYERDVYQAGWAHGYRERPSAQAEPTPQGEKGMWRTRGDTILSQCVYLMEQMYMESLNGVFCQVEDDRCKSCMRMWAELQALMERYDAGER